MRTRITGLAAMLALVLGALATWSWTQGQESPASRPPEKPPTNVVPAAPAAPGATKAPDLSKYSLLQRQMYSSARRGADWLCRANRPDGRFVYGYLPALKTPLEGDHYLRQAGAAVALARAARFTGDEQYGAVARQAVLALLLDTTVDPKDPQVRSTALPSAVVNRLAAAGLLLLAIHELPAPAEDLLKQSDQLCAYIRRQQQSDGSLCYADDPKDTRAVASDPEGINYYPGEALYGLMLSQRHRPAAWKLDVARKALPWYRSWWRSHKNMALVPWMTAACTEAFLQSKEPAFAEFVNEMNDWICQLQYTMLDPRHPFWLGGFMGWMDDKPVTTAPQIGSASYAEGLAEACRVARQTGDLARYRRYRDALERCLQFVTTLQYTEANTLHFSEWYRPVLIGSFFASHQDGNLRIDHTQHAVCALVQYLAHCP